MFIESPIVNATVDTPTPTYSEFKRFVIHSFHESIKNIGSMHNLIIIMLLEVFPSNFQFPKTFRNFKF